jgi:hypothetical protein
VCLRGCPPLTPPLADPAPRCVWHGALRACGGQLGVQGLVDCVEDVTTHSLHLGAYTEDGTIVMGAVTDKSVTKAAELRGAVRAVWLHPPTPHAAHVMQAGVPLGLLHRSEGQEAGADALLCLPRGWPALGGIGDGGWHVAQPTRMRRAGLRTALIWVLVLGVGYWVGGFGVLRGAWGFGC